MRTATEYVFRVRACNELTKLCGNWSANVTGTTSDGIASAPTNLHVICRYYNISDRTVLSAAWEPPMHRNGLITNYHLELNGIASYQTGINGAVRNETYGPKVKTVEVKQQKAEFENIPFNTDFTLKVSAITRSRKPGAAAIAKCSTPRSTPSFNSIFWKNTRSDNQYLIKLKLPELSERNGPICGYRVYLIRMPEQLGLNSHKLPAIDKLNISTYQEVHANKNGRGGVYIAETFSAQHFPEEIVLGDGNIDHGDEFQNVRNSECRKLLKGFVPKSRRTTSDSIGVVKTTTEDPMLDGKGCINYDLILKKSIIFHEIFTDIPDEKEEKSESQTSKPDDATKTRRRRLAHRRFNRRQAPANAIELENSDNGKSTTIAPRAEESIQIVNENVDNLTDRDSYVVFDGPLDSESNYSGFIEVIGMSIMID